MATYQKRGDKWRAIVRRVGHKEQSRTFGKKSQAEAWAHQLENAIASGTPQTDRDYTVAALIKKYRSLRETSRPIGAASNEHYMLKHLEDDLGDQIAGRLTTDDLIGWATMRKDQGAGRYTINMELSKLGTALKYAGSALDLVLPATIEKARPLLLHMNLIGKGGERERRPTKAELDQLLGVLDEPFATIVRFAVATAMRRGEINRITYEDFDRERKLITIRDRKDPREKAGNDQTIPLLNGAFEILSGREGTGRIFPVPAEHISDRFKSACDDCGIEDLHFHDLRHEGISRMFEAGYRIEQVALVSGHKDWRHLRRYTNLRPADLHLGPSGA